MEKYEKVGVIGRGASGTVYLYKRKHDEKLVIIKQMPVEQMSRDERLSALNEGRVLSMLQHPNIIEYYDSFLQDEAIMIVMEYAQGGTLHDFIQRQKEQLLDEQEILNLLAQILLSLQHVHSRQILHRDLKTQNILLDKERKTVKIGDFGISKLLISKSKALTVVGTPSYISPELCEGKAYNQKSDIWALGCILYELMTLKKAFEATTLPALILKILSGNFAPISGNYSKELKELVASLLHLDPNRRPNIQQILAQPVVMNSVANFYTDYGMIEVTNERITPAVSLKTDKNYKKNINKENTGIIAENCTAVFSWGGEVKTPVCLPNLSDKIVSISIGSEKMAVTDRGRVVRWEESLQSENNLVPRYQEGLNAVNIVQVVNQDVFTLCLSDRGILLSHGVSINGCLGHGNKSDVQRPKIIESLLGFEIVKVACGPTHVIAITQDNEIFSWGCGDDGRLGLGSWDSFSSPQRVEFAKKRRVKNVFCARDRSVLLDENGALWATGSNKLNKLWLGHARSGCDKFEMIPNTSWNAPVARVALGVNHSAIVTTDGRIFASDSNENGLDFLEKCRIDSVACGDAFTVVSSTDGRLFCWGKHGRGRLGCEKCEETGHEIRLPIEYPFTVKDIVCWYTKTMVLIEKNV